MTRMLITDAGDAVAALPVRTAPDVAAGSDFRVALDRAVGPQPSADTPPSADVQAGARAALPDRDHTGAQDNARGVDREVHRNSARHPRRAGGSAGHPAAHRARSGKSVGPTHPTQLTHPTPSTHTLTAAAADPAASTASSVATTNGQLPNPGTPADSSATSPATPPAGPARPAVGPAGPATAAGSGSTVGQHLHAPTAPVRPASGRPAGRSTAAGQGAATPVSGSAAPGRPTTTAAGSLIGDDRGPAGAAARPARTSAGTPASAATSSGPPADGATHATPPFLIDHPAGFTPVAPAPVTQAPQTVPASAQHTVATSAAQPALAGALTRLSAGRDGRHEVTIDLHPADLGSVHVRAVLHDGTLNVTVACADDAARQAVLAALPDLHHQLAALTSVDVQAGRAAGAPAVPPGEQRPAQDATQSFGQQPGNPDRDRPAQYATTPGTQLHTPGVSTDIDARRRPGAATTTHSGSTGLDRWM